MKAILRGVVVASVLAASLAIPGGSIAWAEEPVADATTSAPEPVESGSPDPQPSESDAPDPESTGSASPEPTPTTTEGPNPNEGSETPPALDDGGDLVAPDPGESEPDLDGVAAPQTELRSAADVNPVSGTGAVTARVTGVAREFVSEDGSVDQVWPATGDGASDPATIEMTVSATNNLRGRQQLDVSWEGAHPTGGIWADPNSSEASANEYPFVLLQCRGVDTAGLVPTGQVRLTPETCWTQTPGERTYEASMQWPAWRSDRYANTPDRYRWARSPYDPLSARPTGCPEKEQQAIHWLPFRAADGEVYPGTPVQSPDCGRSAPEVTLVDPIGIPSNTTYATTRPDGTGTARFTVWSNKENASLGCSADVSCALVAVPIVGVSCDEWGHGAGSDGTGLAAHDGRSDKSYSSTHAPSPAAIDTATANCSQREDQYDPGVGRTANDPTNPAVTGRLWWSASNWRNRITVPLDFAVSPDVCSVVSHDVPESIFGSAGFTEAAQSWQPMFCTTKSLFSFNHVQAPESNARTLLNSGGASLALTTQARTGGYDRPVARAPIAFSGFAISFNADGKDKAPATDVKLNARLLAKLLTQSYAVNSTVRGGYEAPAGWDFTMSTQPLNLVLDPEFQELNPEFTPPRDVWRQEFPAPAALQIVGADADLMWALTNYIAQDPDARAWIAGRRDPWGMRVNPQYQAIELPVQNWPLLDDWPNGSDAGERVLNSDPCHVDGSPYLPLIHNQLGALATVLENLQFGKSAVKTECEGDGAAGTTYRTQGRQGVGTRFVLGLVPLSGAIRYGLRTAALQTAEDTFVEADQAGLKAAATLLKADAATRSWNVDYAALHTDSANEAYPGLMPIYADVATSDVEAETAGNLADFLCYAATKGQKPGAANGQLPDGYLPISEANGLDEQRQQIFATAAAVRAQKGTIPELGATANEKTACPTAGDEEKDPETTTPNPQSSTSPSVTTDSSTTTTTSASAADKNGSGAPAVVSAPAVRTVGQESAFGTIGPLLLVALLFLTAFGGFVLRWGRDIPAVAAQVPGAARQARALTGRLWPIVQELLARRRGP